MIETHFLLQSGDGPDIVLTEANNAPTELKERWKVTEKIYMVPQYAFAGDFTGMNNFFFLHGFPLI